MMTAHDLVLQTAPDLLQKPMMTFLDSFLVTKLPVFYLLAKSGAEIVRGPKCEAHGHFSIRVFWCCIRIEPESPVCSSTLTVFSAVLSCIVLCCIM